jgi:hypothetical protein
MIAMMVAQVGLACDAARRLTMAVDSTSDSPYTPAISEPGSFPQTDFRTEVVMIRPEGPIL